MQTGTPMSLSRAKEARTEMLLPLAILRAAALLSALSACGYGSYPDAHPAYGRGGIPSTPTSPSSSPLVRLVLSPASITVAAGGTTQFVVSGTRQDGTTTTPTIAYAATGGTITSAGLYTAGTAVGAFSVIATQEGGSLADTARVTVTLSAAPPTALVLVTQPTGAVSGAPFIQQPVVELRSAQNQPVVRGGVVITASRATGPGTLDGTLSATTNAQGRAVFAGLQITGTGAYTLAFTSPGLSRATSATVIVTLASLRRLAAARGFTMGAMANVTPLATDSQYRKILASQYNLVVPGFAMKFVHIHPGPTQYAFADADSLLAFARANGMAVHGHTLVWHSSLPSWITSGTFSRAQLLAVLRDHITTVVGRYAGKVATWDVVNEVMGDNGTSLRSTIWLNTIGAEYIDSAFVWAHRADPTARLFLNDYGAESATPKADGILRLAQGLRARGIPIDGVGFEAHFTTSPPPASSIRANFARFANAGFDIRVSELDVRIPDGSAVAALTAQGALYRDVLDACLLLARCGSLTSWGFTDHDSWIPAYFPGFGRALPFDSVYQPKPAFDSMAVRLRGP